MLEKSDGTVHIKDKEGLVKLLWGLGELVREAVLDFRAWRYTKVMIAIEIPFYIIVISLFL